MLRKLLGSNRFAPLFWCQFFAAFNDNFLKNALVILIVFRLGNEAGAGLVTLAGAIFIMPFLLLSGLAGELADRHDKGWLAEAIKYREIGAAGVAVAGFVLQSVAVLFVALFLFGVLATLFTPVKYGLLPERLAQNELPAGNALVEAATFLAILLGTIVGGLAASRGASSLTLVVLVTAFAVLAWLAARRIPKVAPAAPQLPVDGNILRSSGRLVALIWRRRKLWRTGLMVSWFWTIGAIVLSLVPTLVKDTLGGSETAVTFYLTVFSIGIALGSGLASWLLGGRILLLPSALAAIVMGGFMLDLAVVTSGAPSHASEAVLTDLLARGPALHVAIDFLGIAITGGLLIVPAFAAMQAWSEAGERARAIGGLNVVSSAAMVAGSLAIAGLQWAGVGAAELFFILAIANVLVGLLGLRYLPMSPLREGLALLFRVVYRLEIKGSENLDRLDGGAILAPNHVSYLDAAIALAVLDRDPVFAIDDGMSRRWWVRPLLRFTRALPLDPTKPLATRTLINAVRSGGTLIIFPEGRLTVTGSLMKVYEGAGLIADKSGAPVVPVKIDGLEHSRFTRLPSERARRRWWPKVTVTVLEPVKLGLSPELRGKHRRTAAGAALYDVMSDLVFRTASTDRTIYEAVVAAAREHGLRRRAIEDATGELSYGRLLAAANVLARKLAPLAPEGGAVGVMLPNANAAAATILGLVSAGRVPAMLNFTAGASALTAACTAAEISHVVTARAFVEKAKLDGLVAKLAGHVEIVCLEDIRAGVTPLDRLRGLWQRRRPLVVRSADDPAAILFTSGSEGSPKGVVLSHRNILANAAQAAARIDFGRADKVFNVLPVFHSFGLTVGLILPLVAGVGVFLYPSPLHYRLVPQLIYVSNATILLGTDIFLAGYSRTAHPYDLRSVRYILAGAEPVKEATRRTYAEKFGLRILEGYGATETAPALSLNTPMASRSGTVGRLLPGIEARLETVPGIDDAGRLHVRGPNVMLGYLRAEKPGMLERPSDGWHDTGDIVAIDCDGFVSIKGRAKRFAKIGGEMVSLAAIEALAADIWPEAMSVAVALPDAAKGERITLLTTTAAGSRATFLAEARASGASELMVPAEIINVAALPLLGSGKVDAVAAAKLVPERRVTLSRTVPSLVAAE